MEFSPLIAVHMTAAIAAVAIGPVALWARMGARVRPRLHRAFGYAWVTLMIATAATALFIRDFRLPNIAGFTPLHLFVPVTAVGLYLAFRSLARGDISGHRSYMRRLYLGACVTAGLFTLLPSRLIGRALWGQLWL